MKTEKSRFDVLQYPGCWNDLYYLYESMKVLEIFAFLELLSTATKWIMESDSESELLLIKVTELASSYNSPEDQTVMVYAN